MSKSELERAFAFQVKVAGLPEPEREVRFHPTRRWRLDFSWGEPWWVALEIEGGTYSHGRHTRGGGFEEDCEKYAEAALLGWTVIRVTGKMVKDGRALEYVERALGKFWNRQRRGGR